MQLLIIRVAADMIGDLKTSHLLRSSPKAIFCGQLVGAIVSIFMAAGIYVVFSTAYPCINDLSYTTCSFPIPDVQSWRVGFFGTIYITLSRLLTHRIGYLSCGFIIDTSNPTVIRIYGDWVRYRSYAFGCGEAHRCPA